MDSPLTTEKETRDFIAAFVRYANPKVVVETGCHHGWTSLAIGEALLNGQLFTCDTDGENVSITMERVGSLPVTVFHESGVEMIQKIQQPIDLAYLDSGGNLERFREAQALIPKLAPSAFILLHDINQQEDLCYKHIHEGTNWKKLALPFGRGLAIFQKIPY